MRCSGLTTIGLVAGGVVLILALGLALWLIFEDGSGARTITVSDFRPQTSTAQDVIDSDIVARVRIVEAGPAVWDTLDGNPPPPRPNPPTSDDPVNVIYTPLRAEVLEPLKGSAAGSELVLRQDGGEVGGVTMLVSPSPGLQLGDVAVVFLEQPGRVDLPLTVIESYTLNGEEAVSALDGQTVMTDDFIAEVQRILANDGSQP
jgi:hypothetical protein